MHYYPFNKSPLNVFFYTGSVSGCSNNATSLKPVKHLIEIFLLQFKRNLN